MGKICIRFLKLSSICLIFQISFGLFSMFKIHFTFMAFLKFAKHFDSFTVHKKIISHLLLNLWIDMDNRFQTFSEMDYGN
ncbi:hypothetical protein LEP1GSC089_4312 [Leptospira interrogans serovar Autumnalis str. LP101]|nr:hypothetical protein [Leptospira interrogans]EMN53099.1 hypothetical protein LEP1GSC089_4312 [Leptospira interrogans serovar Autumnalis str. LP101]